MNFLLCVSASVLAIASCGDVGEGEDGPQGPPGPQGQVGPAGPAGASVGVAPEPAGPNCAAGGLKLDSGTGTSYVCNGAEAVAPIGAVIAFAGTQAPDGWLLCDGAAVNRATYGDLYAAIGTAWGEGDAATTFNIPDMRGRFLRGTDRGAGRDPEASGRSASAAGGNIGDRVGTAQGDQLRGHNHTYNGAFTTESVVTGHPQGGTATPYTFWGYGGTTSTAGGAETRPINVSINYIIKF